MSISEEKRFHIVFSNKKTKEIKVLTARKLTFSEVASHAYEQCRKLIDKTGEGWEIVSIYDVSFDFETRRTLY
jgi:prephenate dehydratase